MEYNPETLAQIHKQLLSEKEQFFEIMKRQSLNSGEGIPTPQTLERLYIMAVFSRISYDLKVINEALAKGNFSNVTQKKVQDLTTKISSLEDRVTEIEVFNLGTKN